MLNLDACRTRQERFRARLADAGLDAAVISDTRDIYYLTGILLERFPALLFLSTEGSSWLAAHTDEGDAVVDDRLAYEWHKLYTMNPDPLTQLNGVVETRLADEKGVGRLGWQAESLPNLLAGTIRRRLDPEGLVTIDELLAELQKAKDPDEVELLKRSIGVSLAAYDAAQGAIADGANELEVLGAGNAAALLHAGEVVFHGGDYACAAFGGPARDRQIANGELYIIDAQSTCRGYWTDLSRTFAVGGEPTDLQQSVYDHLSAILLEVPERVKPGGRATEFWATLDARIREYPSLKETGLVHHGGHGVGLRPHEAPDLNRDREGVFEVGDVFSCEPGAYSDELNAGIRLENTFYLGEKGVELLSDYPLNLIPSP